jgi:hypothetical protein
MVGPLLGAFVVALALPASSWGVELPMLDASTKVSDVGCCLGRSGTLVYVGFPKVTGGYAASGSGVIRMAPTLLQPEDVIRVPEGFF